MCAVAPLARGVTATNPNPKTFDTVPTHTETMKTFLAKKSKATSYYPTGMFFKYTTLGNAERLALGEDYKTNGVVRLSWKGTSGESTVTVTRLSDGDKRTLKTTGTSVDFLAPEIGRNYKWTVKNGSDTAGPWYFFTDGEAPRIIPQELSVVGNCRDMGGWVTEDGQYRVRQGLGYRNDHNADFYQYADLKPFWTDIAKVRTDMDLRDKAGKTQWYCNWELDANDSPGRSPYGEHWWDVLYWNVVREGEYGKKMEAYASLVNTRTGDAKKASVNTWKCFADAQNLPIVVHCSQGRDRTGTVAFVLLGALGVKLEDLYADWALTDYAAPSDFPKKSGDEGGSTIVSMYNALKSAYPDSKYPKLQAKCEQLLKDMGMTAAQIANLKSYFLEPVEKKLTAAPGGTSVAVPTLSKTRVSKTGSAQKPTVASSSYYTVDYGGGDYTNYGKYLVTVTLKDPTTTKWSDDTIGPKVLPFVIEHVTNVFIGDAVMSFIKGDTSPHIRIARPRYLGEVSCSYTEEQLNGLPPGDYEATFTAKTCEMASKVNTTTCKFKVYPATEKATYTYEYADLKSAFFKTDYTPAIQTDKIEVQMMDQTDGEGYAPFSCGPYPASLTIMKMSGGYIRYHHGGQRVDLNPPGGTWAINKVYKLTANGKSMTHYDEATAKSVSKSFSSFDEVNPTPGTAYIGCAVEKTANMGAEGTPGYHQPHRIYHVKAWANGSSLIHEFVPCKTTSGYAMLYDKVTKKLYPFSYTLTKTGTVTLGGTATKVEGGDEPVVDPTQPDPTAYGAADTAASTYTWKGGNGPWEHTTNWTASTGAKYGIPSHATYATANFPATVTAATACTLTSDRSVKVAKFDSPNLSLTLNNAKLTVTDYINDDRIGAFNFGDTASGNSTITLSGANAAVVATRGNVRANFGCTSGGATGSCTVKFVVPSTGWTTATTAPIRETGTDAKVCFWSNVRFDIDARALGVPADGTVKRVLLASSTDGIRFYGDADETATFARSTILCADGATGELTVDGNALVLTVTSGDAPAVEPEPEPTPTSAFDAAHTIVCYGDSLTWGTAAKEITMDNRPNYFDGRLAGVSGVPESYTYWLSGMISDYNVINQSREGSPASHMTAWSGESEVVVDRSFTLPATGSVSIPTNLVFTSDCPWGKLGRWAAYPQKGEEQDSIEHWSGFATPIYPLYEPYAAGKTRYSITGTLCGRHVRVQGLWPTETTVTVFGTGTAQTVPVGAKFVPDNATLPLYTQGIRILCGSGNDGYRGYNSSVVKDKSGKTIDGGFAKYAKPYFDAFAAKGGKYLIVSQCCQTEDSKLGETQYQNAPTDMETRMAAEYGAHYLNLRMAFMTNGVETAKALGVWPEGSTESWHDPSTLFHDGTHFTSAGYKVMAEFIRRKLVEIGYVGGDQPTPPPPGPVDPEEFGTNAMANASWGYEIHGLGERQNEVALVFTNCDASAGMSWTVPDGVTSFEFLVVGGGGGGGGNQNNRAGGGGGAGGMVTGVVASVSRGMEYSVVVGDGGAGGYGSSSNPTRGGNGEDSYIQELNNPDASVCAYGGGGGGANKSGLGSGRDGGCGGGVAGISSTGNGISGGIANCGAVTMVADYECLGNAGASATKTMNGGSGGGGAGAAGSVNDTTGGAGGAGVASGITGGICYYAGGGGGRGNNTKNLGGAGGSSIGGRGGNVDAPVAGNGQAATGSGGGGGGYCYSAKTTGGTGGSGVVIIRYARAGGDEPTVDPTEYGQADAAAATYTWKGSSGLWNFTTSWTPSTSSATYGIPNNATYATAEFPATLTDAFTCTVTNDMSVKFAKFDAPNMTLVLDNASLTCNDRLDTTDWGSFYFGHALTGDSTIEIKGAKAALVSSSKSVRASFGALTDGAAGQCTVKFDVPATEWETTAPIRVTQIESKVCFMRNVRFEIDATALGVPAEGQVKTVKLAHSTDGIRFWYMGGADDAANMEIVLARSVITAASGARATVTINGNDLELTVTPDSTPLALALTAPAANATDVAVIRPAQAAFFALDRDARWAQVDDAAARDAMVEASSFPQDVTFAWQGGTAPYAFTLTRSRDGKAVKTVADLTEATVSVGNLETGRAYTWTVTDAEGKSASRSFTTAYADQRFLRVPAANAYAAVKGFASTKSADVHNGYLPNFRDLGGMFTADGSKRVKQGVAYRSFCFDSASVPSLDVDTEVVVGELGVKTDLDLRGGNELVNIKDGKSPLGADVTWVNCPTKSYSIDNLGEADAAALRVFADATKLPVVFHCSAGQDRTGTLAMMLGAILDLDEEDIEKGWSASCFFQNGMDIVDGSGTVVDTGFQTHRVKTFFGDYAKYGQPGDTFAACVRAALKAKLGLTEYDFAAIRANLLEEDAEVTRPVKATVEVPEPNAIAREYDGTAQTTYLRTNPRYTVAMAADAVDPGEYPVTLSLVDPGVCAWADGSADDKTVIFTITGEKPEEDGPVPGFNASTGELTFSNGVIYAYTDDKTYAPTKAIFEPNAAIMVNGAAVSIDKVYLQGAGNSFTAEGLGSSVTLVPYQATIGTANTAVSFSADGGNITVEPVNRQYGVDSNNWKFNQSGMTLALEAWNNAYLGLAGVSFSNGKVLANLADSALKFNDFSAGAAGSEITLDNSTLKTSWGVVMGAADATVALSGTAPLVQGAGGPLTLGAKLTVKLVPEIDWPSEQGRFHSIGTGSNAKITLASGVKFDVDVSKFAGLTTNVTFCLLSAPSAQGALAITLPSAANVTVSGEGAENCTVAFTKSNDNRYVYVTVAATGKGYPDWIGAGDGANKAKFDAWVERFGVTDRSGANETAYLLNCAATDEAIETALEAFKIPSIAVTDGLVEVVRPVHPEAPEDDFNGEVVIRGDATLTGDYELPENSADARFFKAFLEYSESK